MTEKNTSVDDDTATVPEASDDGSPSVAAPVEEQGLQAEVDPLPEKDPGKVLGIVATIIALGAGVIGIALGVVAYRKSRAAGFGGGLGMAAMIIGVVTTVLLVTQLTLLANGMGIGGACDGLKPGIHTLDNGTTISCT